MYTECTNDEKDQKITMLHIYAAQILFLLAI